MRVVYRAASAPRGRRRYLSLTDGTAYEVLGIEGGQLRLLDDRGVPVLFDGSLFEIGDLSEPAFWVSRLAPGGRVAYPPGWGVPGFFEAWEDIPVLADVFSEQLAGWYPEVAARRTVLMESASRSK